MVKNITRTISTMEFPETFKDENEAQNFLYKRYEKGANEMPLFIHELTVVEYKYSMPLDEFMRYATLENVTE